METWTPFALSQPRVSFVSSSGSSGVVRKWFACRHCIYKLHRYYNYSNPGSHHRMPRTAPARAKPVVYDVGQVARHRSTKFAP